MMKTGRWRIFCKKGKEMKRKLATGTVHNIFMSDTLNSVQ